MLVLGSQLHLFTVIVLILELMMVPFVLWYYYAWPKDKSRLWYFILLVLLIFYNLIGGLFPNPRIESVSIPVQNIIAYGSGFLITAFIPFYFYKAFELDALRFHARRGVLLFLLMPYVVFFVLVYLITEELDFVTDYGMVVPVIYSPVLLWSILKSIRENELKGKGKAHQLDIWAVYLAVIPWLLMSAFAYIQIEQWIKVIVTNSGFIILTALFMLRTSQMERKEKERLHLLEAKGERKQSDFQENCLKLSLTRREAQVAQLLCQGHTYEQIASDLFIAKRTVDTHVQNIFMKTEVKKKMDLQSILGFNN